jgi:hypothetical protein
MTFIPYITQATKYNQVLIILPLKHIHAVYIPSYQLC